MRFISPPPICLYFELSLPEGTAYSEAVQRLNEGLANMVLLAEETEGLVVELSAEIQDSLLMEAGLNADGLLVIESNQAFRLDALASSEAQLGVQ